MSIEDHFLDSVLIQRATRTEDPYGNSKLVWSDVGTVPGRLTQKARKVWSDAAQESVIVADHLLLLPAGTDILDRDRVVVDGDTYRIDGVLRRRSRAEHHISVQVSLAE